MSLPVDDQRLRYERIQMMARQARTGTRAAMANTAVLGLLLVPAAGWLPYGVWAALMLAAFLARDAVLQRVVADGRLSERDERTVCLVTAALGLVINLPAPLFMPAMGLEVRGIYTMLQVCWAAVAVMVLGFHTRSYLLYVLMGYTLLGIGWWRSADPSIAGVVTFMLAMATMVLLQFSRHFARVFHETVAMRHEKEALVARLTASIEETAQAVKARSRFLAAASHDLLQPVHAMLLLVSVLRRSRGEAEREQASQRIELTARSIEGMFRGLLDQARLDAGAVSAKITTVSMEAVCRSVEAAYAPRCQEKGLAFTMHCPADVFVRADPTLLERVLRNLVDNAVKFTAQGGVTVTAAREGAEVRVRVVDTGIGIEPDDRGKVFEAFYRGAGATGSGADGVGLGLAVTQQMVALMDGSILVRPAQGGGTCAELTLPAASAAASAATPEPAGLPQRPVHQRVLVVEDDRTAREALHLWLAGHGSEVLSVASLGEALVRSLQQGFVPELILCDLRLEHGANGLATIAELRRRFGPVPAVLVTGDPVEAWDLPHDVALLRKPLHPRDLERVLQRLADTSLAAA